eukprot:2898141-Lingulodinium_polyedra.AAC.1
MSQQLWRSAYFRGRCDKDRCPSARHDPAAVEACRKARQHAQVLAATEKRDRRSRSAAAAGPAVEEDC